MKYNAFPGTVVLMRYSLILSSLLNTGLEQMELEAKPEGPDTSDRRRSMVRRMFLRERVSWSVICRL